MDLLRLFQVLDELRNKINDIDDKLTRLEESQKAMNNNGMNSSSRKSEREIACEVFNGFWGSGLDRKNRLTAAGYDYDNIKKLLNG